MCEEVFLYLLNINTQANKYKKKQNTKCFKTPFEDNFAVMGKL